MDKATALKTVKLSFADRIICESWFASFADEASKRTLSPPKFRYGYAQKDVDRFFDETVSTFKKINCEYARMHTALSTQTSFESKTTHSVSFKDSIYTKFLKPKFCIGYAINEVDWFAERIINLLHRQEVLNKKMRVTLSSR